MKKVLIGIVVGMLIVGSYFMGKQREPKTTVLSSGLVQQQLKNVSKLIITEGHFSDIITYKEVKNIAHLSWLKAEKKAVVLVNAKATVAFDLSLLDFTLDSITQTLTIKSLPKPELQTYPKLEYYDIQADFLNEFTANDYNKIGKLVDDRLQKQISSSSMLKNAENRLISELYALLSKEGLVLKIEYDKSVNRIFN